MSGNLKRRRALALLATVVAGLSLFGGTAGAQYVPVGNESGASTNDAAGNPKSTFAPNEVIRVVCRAPAGNRCVDPNASVAFGFEQSPRVIIGRMNADANGRYDTRDLNMRIPADAKNGNASITVESVFNGRPILYTNTITVTGAAAATAAPRVLPITGRDLALFALWGLVLVGFGSVLISATWRRWQESRLEAHVGGPAPERVARRDDSMDDYLANLRPAPTRAMPLVVDDDPRPEPEELLALDDDEEVDAPELVSVAAAPPAITYEPVSFKAGGQIRESVRRATTQTSDVVTRLQDEIRSWSRGDD